MLPRFLRRRIRPFTDEELRGLASDFVAHFGHLEELAKIRAQLAVIADRIESLTIAIGAPGRRV